MYIFADQASSDNYYKQSIKKQKSHLSVKETLRQCKNTIGELVQSNQELLKKLKQKQTILLQLIEEKQQYLLHKANCNTQALIKQLQTSSQRQQQLTQLIKEIEQKYEKMIEKHQSQIQRLSCYNRALRIDNAALRDFKEAQFQKKRKNGLISQSVKKQQHVSNQFQITRINEQNVQQKLQRHFSVNLQTPNKSNSYVKYNCPPSTEPSLKAFHSMDITSEKLTIPKNLFSNRKIRQYAPRESFEPIFSSNVVVNNRLMSIENVIRRVNELLTASEEQC